MDKLFQYIRFGLRTLARSRGFTIATILSLALGIGLNTAIFSVVNAVLLRPLPYHEPDRVVRLWGTNEQKGPAKLPISLPDFADWKAQSQSFEGMAATTDWLPVLTGVDIPQELLGAVVTHDFFSVLGVHAAIGRTFSPEDGKPDAEPVVVLTHDLWQRSFGADPGLIDKPLTLSGKTYKVIGVLPADFEDPKLDVKGAPQVWHPVTLAFSELSRAGHFARAIARLKPGVSLEGAQRELSMINGRLQQEYPASNAGWNVLIVPLRDEIIGKVRTALLVLLGAVGLVLLIACANVVNGLLVRFMARSREIAVRTALGAGRRDLILQLLVESLLLSLCGGAAGLLLAFWGIKLLVGASPAEIPRIETVHLDGTVLAFSLVLSLLTGVIFGLLPAVQAARPNLQESLKDGGRQAGSRRSGLRSLITVGAVSLALVLVVSASLLIKSLILLETVDPGFSTENLLTLRLSVPARVYPEPDQVQGFYDQVYQRLSALPGIKSVGAVHLLPLTGGMSCDELSIEGQSSPSDNLPCAEARPSTPTYFQTMQILLRQGRLFTDHDDAHAPQVAIVNQTMVKRFWPGNNPLGARLTFHGVSREVVGVVGDVHHFGLDTAASPEVYVPQRQEPWKFMAANMFIVLRATGSPESSIPAVQREIVSLNKDIPVSDMRTMSQLVAGSVAQRRFRTLLLGGFAATALLLSGIGLYSLISYAVAQRTHELGVRQALGAQPRDLLSLVVGQGLRLAAVGLAVGTVVSLLTGRLLVSLLYGVSAYDPVILLGAVLVFVVISFLASYLPARRASRVAPAVALHYE